MKTVEYRVRPVTRYIVTKWHRETLPSGNECGGCETFGEYDNEHAAERVMSALRAGDPECLEPLGELVSPKIAATLSGAA